MSVSMKKTEEKAKKETTKRISSVAGHLKRFIKEKNQYISIVPSVDDICLLYFRFMNTDGDNNEFKGGVYYGTITIPTTYPFTPPIVLFNTPTGVFPINDKFCVDSGHYHPERYSPSLGFDGFVRNIWAGMIVWKDLIGGINIQSTTVVEKVEIAQRSIEYNRLYNQHIINLFE